MTVFDGLRETWEPAEPRPWMTARRLVGMTLGIVYGAAFALLLP